MKLKKNLKYKSNNYLENKKIKYQKKFKNRFGKSNNNTNINKYRLKYKFFDSINDNYDSIDNYENKENYVDYFDHDKKNNEIYHNSDYKTTFYYEKKDDDVYDI